MLIISLFIISIITQKILTEEKNINGFFTTNKIYELNDTSFDLVLQEGNIYRWLILFYSDSNTNCTKAKKEIENIFNSYKDINELKFAQMNIEENIMTNIRLNITEVPYIILLENDTIYEMNSTLSYENLDDFIFTIFSEVKEDLKTLPEKVSKSYIQYIRYKQKLDTYVNEFNQFLFDLGIKIHLNLLGFIIFIVCCIIIFYFSLKIIYKYWCCSFSDETILELEQLEDEFNKRKDEIENEEKIVNDNEDDLLNEEEEMVEYIYEEEDEEDDDYEDYYKRLKEEEEKRRLEEERKKIMEEKKKKKQKNKYRKKKNNNRKID